jgi:serine/threonine-protein kinase
MTDERFKKGDACGSYEIIRPLGSGGMGTVYEAVHLFTRKPAAVKILRDRLEGDHDALGRLQREAEALARMESPNIVALRDVGFHNGVGYLVMELLSGTTLRKYMRSVGRLAVADALYVAREIADGLDVAHEFSVLHRDVKPENVQITAAHEVKLLDFGASKQYGRGLKSTDRVKIMGTPHYMSPEHLLGEKLDGRTDLYALGVILYEMLAGRHPLDVGEEQSPLEEVRRMLFHRTPAPLSPLVAELLPKRLEAFILKLLAKNRDERYADASEVAQLLNDFLQDVVAAGGTGRLGPYDMPSSQTRVKGAARGRRWR